MADQNIFNLIRTVELFTNEAIIRFSQSFHQNIGIPQILVLAELIQGPQKLTILARTLGYTPGGMTNIVDKLIKENLAERQFDASDRRIILLQITEHGKGILKEAEAIGVDMRKDMYSILNDEEIKQLTSIKRKMYEYLRQKNY